MAAIDWPDSTELPQYVEQDGYSVTPQQGTLITKMDTGPTKVRRRFSATAKYHNCNMVMTKTEYQAFQTFYHTTTKEGSLPFNFPDPLNESSTIEVRFRSNKGYQIQSNGPFVNVSYVLEELP